MKERPGTDMLKPEGKGGGLLTVISPESCLHSLLFFLFQAYSPIPSKKSKHDRSRSPSLDKEKQADWLQSITASSNKDVKQFQFKQRPSAFRPWSPRVPSAERDAPRFERSLPKAQDSLAVPNVSLPIAAFKNHEQPTQQFSNPNESNISVKTEHSRTRKRWPSTERHSQLPVKTSLLSPVIRQQPQETNDSESEIEVDNCREAPVSQLLKSPPLTNGMGQMNLTPHTIADVHDGTGRAKTTVSSELDVLKQTLSSDLSSKEAREKILQEVVHMRIKQEEKLAAALQAKRNLQQELEFVRVTKKGRLREAIEAKRSLRKEIGRLRVECEKKVRDAHESCDRLKRELDRERQLRGCDEGCEAGRLKAKYSSQIEELEMKLQQAEVDREQLREDLLKERDARQSLERVVKDLQDQLRQKAESIKSTLPNEEEPRENCGQVES
ncbi:hypothetical protein DNTS_015930 [Danionella cerebrum]|uniref:Uncharacterized protein n=1 Tax=Danionella cerebrum TaxID=2873325 RepID=A0A553NM91_9TELE|nr:hypothetical protein DNTS_015930 [Danionella translucida]